jgi:hypothetical protein
MLVRKYFAAASSIVLVGIVFVGVQSASAGRLPLSGPVNCDLAVATGSATINPALPAQTPSRRSAKFTFTSDLGTCVNAGTDLAIGRVSMVGRVPSGVSCANQFGSDEPTHFRLGHAVFKIRWIGVNGENFGTSTAQFADMVLSESPSYAFDFVSAPIHAASLHGEVIRIHAVIANLAQLESECSDPSGAVSQIQFGGVTLDVS